VRRTFTRLGLKRDFETDDRAIKRSTSTVLGLLASGHGGLASQIESLHGRLLS